MDEESSWAKDRGSDWGSMCWVDWARVEDQEWDHSGNCVTNW